MITVSKRFYLISAAFALLGAVVLAAIITPTPDPGTQMLVAVPLYFLYEIGILLSRVA